jgi:hypothetical protein
LAIIGDFRCFGRRVLGRRRTKLLYAFFEVADTRLQFVDLGPDGIGGGVELGPQTGEGVRCDILAADGGLNFIQRGLQRFD